MTAATIAVMHKPAPIRRYVLLGQRQHGSAQRRWSLERIAPAPHGGARAPQGARSAGK